MQPSTDRARVRCQGILKRRKQTNEAIRRIVLMLVGHKSNVRFVMAVSIVALEIVVLDQFNFDPDHAGKATVNKVE